MVHNQILTFYGDGEPEADGEPGDLNVRLFIFQEVFFEQTFRLFYEQHLTRYLNEKTTIYTPI